MPHDILSLPVTSLYGGVLAIGYAALALPVALHRLKTGLSTGEGGDAAQHKGFSQRIRAHGNYGEYAPFVVTLMALMEAQQVLPTPYLHAFGATFTVLRLLHSVQMYKPSKIPQLVRAAGFVSSLTALVVGGGLLVASSLRS